MRKQHDIFKYEGNRWFSRNPRHLQPDYPDHITAFLRTVSLRPKRILDIGCANGYRLQMIRGIIPDAEAYGIEPSNKAVQDGIEHYPELHLAEGFSHDLSLFSDNYFDMVVVSFVLHWVDRTKLLTTISEIDRVLNDGGTVMIQDFAPGTPCKTSYHHLPEESVFTYKQAYWTVFTASNLYSTIFLQEFQHDPNESIISRNLCALAVLQKRLDLNYPLV